MPDIPTFALLLCGEQFVFLAIPILLAAVALLIWLVVLLTRKLRAADRKNRMVLIGLVLASIVFVGFFLRGPSQSIGPPEVLPASEIPKIISRLPEYASFGISGLAFFDGKLYATSNIGIIEIENGVPARLHRFNRRDSVVSGPWVDPSNRLLWVKDDSAFHLVRFDGREWKRPPMPQPEKGYYSRGDALQGARMVHDGTTLWMHIAGSAYRWNPAREEWTLVPGPPLQRTMEDVAEGIGVLTVEGQPTLIMRHEGLAFLVKDTEEFKSDTVHRLNGGWKQIPGEDGFRFFAEHWVTSGSGFICSRAGEALRVTQEKVERLSAPGRCETVQISSSGNPVFAIRDQGIYLFHGDWKLLADHPYKGGGDYWIHLAEADGVIALAIDPKPVVDRSRPASTDIKFVHNAPSKLWLIRDGVAQEIRME